MQKPLPMDAVGVTVKLLAISPDGNVQNLGSATTDVYGNYGFSWTPTTQGIYQIVASFDSTNSYWGSQDSAYLSVGPAASQSVTSPTPTTSASPSATSTPQITPTLSPSTIVEPGTSMSTETLLIAGAAVVIIIAVVAAALVLRKRK
jgi:hypothetical protein